MLPSRLNELLRQTSRSFYLTLRVLPGAIRPQIGLAYLLARTTDTIADTELLPVAERLTALQQLRDRIAGAGGAPLVWTELTQRQADSAERVLLERVEEALAELARLPPADARRVREVLDTITSGQALDLHRFGGNSPVEPGQPRQILALASAAELDDYTYRVAGCVGEFWTHMCLAHLFSRGPQEHEAFLAAGIRFGKGLQLVNILRDLPRDLRQGRCYLPAAELNQAGLTPGDLLDPENENRFRPVYDRHLATAESHLAAGWSYTNSIPRGQVRVRLACAWPVLIGLETLARLRSGPVLDPAHRIKISRAAVWRIIFATVCRYPMGAAWRGLAHFSQE